MTKEHPGQGEAHLGWHQVQVKFNFNLGKEMLPIYVNVPQGFRLFSKTITDWKDTYQDSLRKGRRNVDQDEEAWGGKNSLLQFCKFTFRSDQTWLLQVLRSYQLLWGFHFIHLHIYKEAKGVGVEGDHVVDHLMCSRWKWKCKYQPILQSMSSRLKHLLK